MPLADNIRTKLEETERAIIGMKKDARRDYGRDESLWPANIRDALEKAKGVATWCRTVLKPEEKQHG